jgi:hypothetical protein
MSAQFDEIRVMTATASQFEMRLHLEPEARSTKSLFKPQRYFRRNGAPPYNDVIELLASDAETPGPPGQP